MTKSNNTMPLNQALSLLANGKPLTKKLRAQLKAAPKPDLDVRDNYERWFRTKKAQKGLRFWLDEVLLMEKLLAKAPQEIWGVTDKDIILMSPYTKEVVISCRTSDEAKLLCELRNCAFSLISTAKLVAQAPLVKNLEKKP